MAALPYMQLYVADYLADTMHLNAEQHGAYLLLIMNYWQTGKPIPKGRLHKIARVSAEHWAELEESLEEFFEDDGECWIHLRIEKDLDAVHTSPRGKKLPGSESLKGYKGYVYFVTSASNEMVKIGYSKNPWARLSELRRSYGEELAVVATVKTVEKSEVSVHKVLEKFRLEGEWFSKSECVLSLIQAINDDVVTTVEALSSYVVNYGIPPTPPTNTNTDTDTDTEQDTDKQQGSASSDASPAEPEKPAGVRDFPTKDGKQFTPPEQFVQELKSTYPRIDVEYQLKKARLWLIANPGRQKTPRGMTRFLNNWMSNQKPTAEIHPIQSRHTGFEDRDYSEGLIEGVSDDAANF